MLRTAKAISVALMVTLTALTVANAETGNLWRSFYADAPAIRVVDPMVNLVGSTVGAQDTLTIHLSDIALYTGHVCPGVASGYMLTRAALAALYPESLPERGQIRVAASKPACWLDVASYITGARGAWGRAEIDNVNDLVVDPALQSEGEGHLVVVFQRKDTGAAVKAIFNVEQIMSTEQHEGFKAFHTRVLDGTASEQEKQETWSQIQSLVRAVLLDTPEGLFEITPIEDYDFPAVPERQHDH